jgi:hypothetical protein
MVRNVTWSGPGAPEHPTFPLTKGLTSAAIAQKQIVNVGDVMSDPRYLTAFGTTRSEIIVPVFDAECLSWVALAAVWGWPSAPPPRIAQPLESRAIPRYSPPRDHRAA